MSLLPVEEDMMVCFQNHNGQLVVFDLEKLYFELLSNPNSEWQLKLHRQQQAQVKRRYLSRKRHQETSSWTKPKSNTRRPNTTTYHSTSRSRFRRNRGDQKRKRACKPVRTYETTKQRFQVEWEQDSKSWWNQSVDAWENDTDTSSDTETYAELWKSYR